jgi:hypothetical protein
MTIKIYLTHPEKDVIASLTSDVGEFLEEGGLKWSGTPYQTANTKILGHYLSDSAIKFTEDEIGAIMCAFSVLLTKSRAKARNSR